MRRMDSTPTAEQEDLFVGKLSGGGGENDQSLPLLSMVGQVGKMVAERMPEVRETAEWGVPWVLSPSHKQGGRLKGRPSLCCQGLPCVYHRAHGDSSLGRGGGGMAKPLCCL